MTGRNREARSLPKGISAWSYSFDENIVKQIDSFNSLAKPHLQFKYLFSYAGSLDFDKETRESALFYNPKSISDRYTKRLPSDTLIMPIIDARADKREFDDWSDEQYRAVALKVAKAIGDDRNAAGVQVDIEPFSESHLPFYGYLHGELKARDKYTTLFAGAQKKKILSGMMKSCDIVIISGYDLNGENLGVARYKKLLQSSVARVHKVAVETDGRYMVGIPAAASWGEYEYTIDAGGRNRTETGIKQEDYVRAAMSVLEDYDETPEFIGAALWQLSRVRTADEADSITKRTKMPDYIRPGVWKMLGDY